MNQYPSQVDVSGTNYPKRRLISGLVSLPLIFAASVMLLMPVTILNPALALDIRVALPITLVAELVAIAVGLSIGWPKAEWKEALAFRKPKLSALFVAAGLGISLFFALQGLANLLASNGTPIESSDTSSNLGALTGVSRIIIFYMVSPILVPFIEELFFRGWVFHAFLGSNLPAKTRPAAAVLISALFFAVLHMQGFSNATDLLIPVWIFFMATVQGALMLRYKSIWVTVTLHIFYNGITVIMSTLAQMS